MPNQTTEHLIFQVHEWAKGPSVMLHCRSHSCAALTWHLLVDAVVPLGEQRLRQLAEQRLEHVGAVVRRVEPRLELVCERRAAAHQLLPQGLLSAQLPALPEQTLLLQIYKRPSFV